MIEASLDHNGLILPRASNHRFTKFASYHSNIRYHLTRITFNSFVYSLLLISCTSVDFPLIKEKVDFGGSAKNEAVTFVVTAERRFMILFPSEDGKIRVCAEPSPDIAQTISILDQFSLGASVSDSSGTHSAGVDLESLSYYSVAALLLTQRSQGLQLYRDGMYYYCQMFMADALTWGDYLKKEEQLRDAAVRLIEQQIEKLPDLQSLAAPQQQTPLQPTTDTKSNSDSSNGQDRQLPSHLEAN